MTYIPVITAHVYALAVTGYSIRRVREVRAMLEREQELQRKADGRRADAWAGFCDGCKKIAAPWWSR